MHLKIVQELDENGHAFGVPKIYDARSGLQIEGITEVDYHADQDSFPEIVVSFTGALTEIELHGYEPEGESE